MVGSPTVRGTRVDTHISLSPDETPTTLADSDTVITCHNAKQTKIGAGSVSARTPRSREKQDKPGAPRSRH